MSAKYSREEVLAAELGIRGIYVAFVYIESFMPKQSQTECATSFA